MIRTNDDEIVKALKDYRNRVPTQEIISKHNLGRGTIYYWASKIGLRRGWRHDWERIRHEVLG